MTIEELRQERAMLDKKIAKLSKYVETAKEEPILLPEYLASAIEFIPEVMIAALLPGMMGVEMYSEALDPENSLASKIALTTLFTPLALPCIALSLILVSPIAIPALAISSIVGGVQSTYAGTHNARIKKAKKKLKSLKAKRDELDSQIAKVSIR